MRSRRNRTRDLRNRRPEEDAVVALAVEWVVDAGLGEYGGDQPRLDGYATATIIRSQGGHHRTIPIIALSGYEPRTHAAKIEAAGMNDCLTKPVLIADLKAVLDKWLS